MDFTEYSRAHPDSVMTWAYGRTKAPDVSVSFEGELERTSVEREGETRGSVDHSLCMLTGCWSLIVLGIIPLSQRHTGGVVTWSVPLWPGEPGKACF